MFRSLTEKQEHSSVAEQERSMCKAPSLRSSTGEKNKGKNVVSLICFDLCPLGLNIV